MHSFIHILSSLIYRVPGWLTAGTITRTTIISAVFASAVEHAQIAICQFDLDFIVSRSSTCAQAERQRNLFEQLALLPLYGGQADARMFEFSCCLIHGRRNEGHIDLLVYKCHSV